MLNFHPEAVLEIKRSIQWYGDQSKKAEEKLKEELNRGFERIIAFPLSYPEKYKTYRAYKLKSFPFLIVYTLRSDDIFILAIFHTSRNPNILENRIGSV